jgi:hypothetical protein
MLHEPYQVVLTDRKVHSKVMVRPLHHIEKVVSFLVSAFGCRGGGELGKGITNRG